MQLSIRRDDALDKLMNSKPVRAELLWRTMARASNAMSRTFHRSETLSPTGGGPQSTAESPPKLISRVRPRVSRDPLLNGRLTLTGALMK